MINDYNHIEINGKLDLISNWIETFSFSQSEYFQHTATFLKEWINDKEYVIVQTSGSTGKPKDIKLLKKDMIASAKATGNYFNLKEGNTGLLCLPIKYIAGKMMLVRAIVLKLNLVLIEPSLNPLESLTTKIDFAALIPLQVKKAFENNSEKFDLIQKLIIGGAPVSRRLHQLIRNINTDCYATYGMTETVTHIAVKSLNGENESKYFEALKGVTFFQDNRGCLTVSVKHLSIKDLITNDIVELDDFTHFEWIGRFDNVINSGGVKLFPEKIETKIAAILDRRYFITSKPCEKLNQKLVLVIEGGPFDKSTNVLFKSSLEDELEKIEIPKEIIFLEHFKETETGKVKREIN